MSLRYKALIAVLLLVALVTGGLGVYVSDLYRDAEIRRIRIDLSRDARSLNLELGNVSLVARTALENSARSTQMANLLSDSNLGKGQTFETPAGEWLAAVNADYALAAVDSFVAEERHTNVLKKHPDLSVVALIAKGKGDEKRKAALLESEPLYHLIQKCFEQSGATGKPKATFTTVIAAGDAVFLVVVSPLYDSLQEFSIAGVGVVFIELSSAWVREHRAASSDENPIEQVIVAGGAPRATSLPEATKLAPLETGIMAGAGEFQTDLEIGGGTETCICRFAYFDLAEGKDAGRPGFVAVKDLDKELEPLVTLQNRVGIGGLVLGIIGAVIAYGGAYLVIRKLRTLQMAAIAVREGKFDTRVDIGGRDEIGALGDAFNNMTTGLKALGIYTDHKLATTIMRDAKALVIEGARETGSVFFSDIKGFTGITESLNAAQLVTLLGEYFTEMSDAVKAEGGYVDKFIGDAVMAYWGPPFVKDGYGISACRAAVLCMRAAAKLRERWKKEGKPPFYQRIGIATGEVTVGNIGSATKKNFTVIGDSVNLASRLEGANKVYKTEILVDERTAELASGEVLTREIDQIRVVGKLQPTRIYELLALARESNARHITLCKLYGAALQAYREKKFAEGAKLAGDALAQYPEDGPSAWLKARCEGYMKAPPPEEWEPVTTATEK
jgi:class 3 adenylate cyclase/HAMP domain-containing protein